MTSVIKPRYKIFVRCAVCEDNYEVRCELFVKYANILWSSRSEYCKMRQILPKNYVWSTVEHLWYSWNVAGIIMWTFRKVREHFVNFAIWYWKTKQILPKNYVLSTVEHLWYSWNFAGIIMWTFCKVRELYVKFAIWILKNETDSAKELCFVHGWTSLVRLKRCWNHFRKFLLFFYMYAALLMPASGVN